VSRFLARAEIWIALGIFAAACATSPYRTSFQGQVVAVSKVVSRGDLYVQITVGWRSDPEHYEQATAIFQALSMEATAFGVSGRCVEIVPMTAKMVKLERCR